MYGYFNNDPLLSCSAFHYVSTMLFPISNIHEKETRKQQQQQQTNEKRQKKNQKLNKNKTKTTKHTKKLPPSEKKNNTHPHTHTHQNNHLLTSCSAFHHLNTMLFPISHIYEKETRKQQQTNEKDSYLKIKNPKQKTHNKNNPLK